MKKVLATIAVLLIVLVVGVVAFVFSGIYNVAADDKHTQLVAWLLETTQEQSITMRTDNVLAPPNFTNEYKTARGAREYASMCVMCHLAPGIKPTPLHTGLNPEPPRLAQEAGEHSSEYLFWTIKHGIKMTGMPAWGLTHTDDEIWDLVAFLKVLPSLTPEQYKAMAESDQAPMHEHQ